MIASPARSGFTTRPVPPSMYAPGIVPEPLDGPGGPSPTRQPDPRSAKIRTRSDGIEDPPRGPDPRSPALRRAPAARTAGEPEGGTRHARGIAVVAVDDRVAVAGLGLPRVARRARRDAHAAFAATLR